MSDNKWPSTSLEGDKFWCAVVGSGGKIDSLPIINTRSISPSVVANVVGLVDSIDIPLQVNPDGTTKWIIGIGKKGKRTNVVSLKQLQDAVGGPIELLKYASIFCSSPKVKGLRRMYVNEEGRPRNLPINHFATYLRGSIDGSVIVGSVVLMPNRRLD